MSFSWSMSSDVVCSCASAPGSCHLQMLPFTSAVICKCCHLHPAAEFVTAVHGCRACSFLASVQDAQVQAAQALHGLVAVVNRSSASARTQAASTPAVAETLACFKQSLRAVTMKPESEHAASHTPWVLARQAGHSICQQAAQVGLHHLLH